MRCMRRKNDTRALFREFHNFGRSLERADSSVPGIQLFQPTWPCCWPCPGVPRRLWQVGTEQGVAGGVETFQASTGCPLLFLQSGCSQSTGCSHQEGISHWGRAAAAIRCLPWVQGDATLGNSLLWALVKSHCTWKPPPRGTWQSWMVIE